MNVESIQVPAERVPPVASDMASSSKVAAGVLIFVAAIIAIAMIGVVSDSDKKRDTISDSAEAAGHAAGTVIGAVLMAGLPAIFGFRAARNASRANRAGETAKTQPSVTWRLSGKHIIAADSNGAPRPELSFKVNQKLRTMLLAVPRAEVIDKS